jgi:hypothetical protein
LAGA